MSACEANKPHLNLSLVIPVFNEETSIQIFIDAVADVFHGMGHIDLDITFVNDGSTDRTLDVLTSLQKQHANIKVVDLSRNFGKEAALTAGLEFADGQVVVPMDADLQDPPSLIPKMIELWREGYEVVLARRTDRTSDTWLKKVSANCFYRIHNKISAPKLPQNVGDFRLMDRRVVDAVKSLPESRRFMKGLFSWVGFRTGYVDYARPKRAADQSKFNGWQLWNLALDGITSFSTVPLRIWTYIGLSFSIVSIVFALFIAAKVIVFGIDVPGYASIVVLISFLGGLQLMGIGVLGEYLGRVYIEAKGRPTFIVKKVYTSKGSENGP